MEEYRPENVLIQEETQGVKRLRWLQQALEATPAELATYSAGDFRWMMYLLNMLVRPAMYGKFETAITREDAATYLSATSGLDGMYVGMDSDQEPFWVTVWLTYRTPGDLETAANMLLTAVKHNWMMQLTRKLANFILEIPDATVPRLKAGVVETLMELAQAIVTVDTMNRDKTMPFEARLYAGQEVFVSPTAGCGELMERARQLLALAGLEDRDD